MGGCDGFETPSPVLLVIIKYAVGGSQTSVS